jgi:hypothetical protein
MLAIRLLTYQILIIIPKNTMPNIQMGVVPAIILKEYTNHEN